MDNQLDMSFNVRQHLLYEGMYFNAIHLIEGKRFLDVYIVKLKIHVGIFYFYELEGLYKNELFPFF